MKQLYWTLVVAIFLTISACAPNAAQAEPTATASSTPVRSSSATTAPTESQTPVAVPRSSTPSPVPSPTPGPNFAEASIYSVAHLQDNRLMITIHVPGGVEGAFDAYVGSSYLPCETPYQYPERIHCFGPEPYINYSPEGARVTLYPLYHDSGSPPIFEGFITIPAQATPTATQPIWNSPVPELPGPGTPFPPFP